MKNISDLSNEKRVAFIFWRGEKESITELLNSMKKHSFKVVLGPSKSDHDFLMKNFAYYKMAYEQKIWAFCSDVWRLYKLSKYKGMYIDASVVVGENIKEFYDKNISYDVSLFKETQAIVANCVLFSGKENNIFYKNILELYKIDYVKELPLRIYPIAPLVLSSFILNNGINYTGFSDNKFVFKNQTIKINSLKEIRDNSTLFKSGFGSWWHSEGKLDNKTLSKSHWDELENRWNRSVESHEYDRQIKTLTLNKEMTVWIRSLLGAYVVSKSKQERDNLKKAYDSIGYKIFFSELLIWAKINRILNKKNKL